MARTYFAEVETGKRNVSMRNLLKIANGLGVTLAEFFDSDVFDPLYRAPGICDEPAQNDRVSYALVRFSALDVSEDDRDESPSDRPQHNRR